MVKANTYDEKIIQGIEQILQDYRLDFYIQKKLEQGNFFDFFKGHNGSVYSLYPDGKVHCTYGNPPRESTIITLRKAAEDYFYDCFRADPLNITTVTGVKLKLLTDLEEKAKEFRKFPC